MSGTPLGYGDRAGNETARDLCTIGARIPVEGGAERLRECQRATHVTEKNNTRAKGSDGRGHVSLYTQPPVEGMLGKRSNPEAPTS